MKSLIKIRVILWLVIIISIILLMTIFFTPTTMTDELDSYAKVGDPGEELQFNYTIRLEGGFHILHIKIQDVSSFWGWDVSVNNDDFIINAGEKKTVTFTVEIPNNISDESKFNNSNLIEFYIVEEDIGSEGKKLEHFIAYSSNSNMSETWAEEDNSIHSSYDSGYSRMTGIVANWITIILGIILILFYFLIVINYYQEGYKEGKSEV